MLIYRAVLEAETVRRHLRRLWWRALAFWITVGIGLGLLLVRVLEP